ncbi:Procollagen-lysine,2-oxoglutarate 5-dioxygenase 1 [Portunus trituberculatus]|uniref:Procollagen-lysine,2-oxoglutarate 5-dioxygenase 1 n=1 Tax=Portunus trituberculatus TaxID=210409 RepID=A0A5B7EWI7_PORTR|nr:Procollagen-lysine,2-oxoglutarate 5-dioxygenase 1 [Portunus trituberculatus]
MAQLPSHIVKAELFSLTFANKSTLDDSGLIPPSPSPSDYFMSSIKVLCNDFFHALAGLNLRKAYGPDGVRLIVLKNCAFMLAPCLAKLFQLSIDLYLSFMPTFNRSLKGATLRVAEVQALRVVHRDYLEDLMLGRQVDQYINTRVRPGLLLDPRGHKEGKLHPDLWGLTYNPRAWRQRYIHPDLLSIIWGKAKAEEYSHHPPSLRSPQVGKDLYYVPLFKERFCRELVEELEHFGQWQHKDMDDREEAHHYTSTNINLSQIDYEAEYHVVINTLHKVGEEIGAALAAGYLYILKRLGTAPPLLSKCSN